MSHMLKAVVLAAALLVATPVLAEEPVASSADEATALDPVMKPYLSALKVATQGPKPVALANQATLKLPPKYLFIPKKEAGELLEAMGNSSDDTLLGMVMPPQINGNWMVVARYEEAGYIKDDDAKNWNADDLLKSLKEGTEASNEERRDRGFPEIEVLGWVEKPTYDAAHRRLVWSASSRHKNAEAGESNGINYNTYALGREGYISLNLVTDLQHIEADKPVAKTLLSALQFNKGKRYEDFDASTDKVAEYGLAALVAGVAAKKLGLFALAGLLFAKFFKIIVVAGLALVAFLSNKLFRKKPTPEAAAPEATAEAAPEAPVLEVTVPEAATEAPTDEVKPS